MVPYKLYLIKIMCVGMLIGTLVVTWFLVMITTNAFAESLSTILGHREKMVTNITVIIGCIIQILCLAGIVAAVLVNIWYPF